jgi:hypothetical protein
MCILAVAAMLAGSGVWAQPPAEPQETFLGVVVSSVPELLYSQLPQLPRNRGVVVTQVLPDSPATHADLKRHDILLAYNGKPIENCDHFARLIRADKPNQKVKLDLLRAGRPRSIEATLGSGPPQTVAQNPPPAEKGIAKGEGPGKVSVHVTPLADNKMAVTIEYYEAGKLRSVSRSGNAADIDREVLKLPPRVQDLARAGLQRIRALEAQR